MADLKQAATNTVELVLGTGGGIYPKLDIGFYQNGRKVLTYTQDDVTIADGVASFTITAADAAKLGPARSAIEVRAATADGSSVILSDSIVATVERSIHR